jgi:DNA mismatch endonuclease (patch repair protein)
MPRSETALTDNLTPEQRSYCMSQVRNKRTGIERIVENALRRAKIKFERNHQGLPGSPDFVIASLKTAVFVDGDFWHGYRFPRWADTLAPFWKEKIQRNRARDRRSHAALRRMGWRVVRLWQHQIKDNLEECLNRIVNKK